YTIFSMAPLLVIGVAIAGFVFGEAAAQDQIVSSLEGVIGADAAATIQDLVQNASQTGTGAIATIIGVVTLLLAASGLFAALQGALNTIWDVEPAGGGGILRTVKQRGLAFLMVLGIGLLFLLSLAATTVLTVVRRYFQDILPVPGPIWQIASLLLSLAIFTVSFAAVFKVLPDVKIEWKYLWIGAAFTAVLFVIGEYLISLYLSISSPGSTYGAAGSLFVILLWIYYSAQVFFLGAEFTQVYARRQGARIVPDENARWIGPAALSGEKPMQFVADKEKQQTPQPTSRERRRERERER
ncbi:MAG: YihY/virulence factor BrkB family protein, partial [Chloroflexi bacterium]|nr:YihY/virulence factor BrkB family protein [Chloroflexota bacterium]